MKRSYKCFKFEWEIYKPHKSNEHCDTQAKILERLTTEVL